MASLRSELRRDLSTMIRTMVQPDLSSGQMYGSLERGAAYASNVRAVPAPQANSFNGYNVAVPNEPSATSYILPFVAGCALSCIGLSYTGLVIYALIRH